MVKALIYIILLFVILLISTIINVVVEKEAGGNNFSTPTWGFIASILIPYILIYRINWRKEKKNIKESDENKTLSKKSNSKPFTKEMKKTNKHLLASIILLFLGNVYLNWSIYHFNDIYFSNAISNYFVSVIICGVIALIFYLVKKKSSFIKVLYKTFYVMSFIVFSAYWMGYIGAKFGIWAVLIFFLIIFLFFSKRGKAYISKLNLFSKENNISNNESISEDISSKMDDIKSSSKQFTKEIENSLNETIKVAKEKSKPIINKAKKGVDELINNSSKKSKDQSIEELKKIKELLDLELISQEEFDNKSKELKKIILDN